jgi:hypothetical protein
MNTKEGFHHRGHRGHGEPAEKTRGLTNHGTAIPPVKAEALFSVVSVRSVVNPFFAGQLLS